MDNQINRYLSKIGLSDKSAFELAHFSVCSHSKSDNILTVEFSLPSILQNSEYVSYFQAIKEFEKSGGFKTEATFSYELIDQNAIESLVDDHLDAMNITSYYEIKFENGNIYVGFLSVDEELMIAINNLSLFLKKISLPQKVLSYTITHIEEKTADEKEIFPVEDLLLGDEKDLDDRLDDQERKYEEHFKEAVKAGVERLHRFQEDVQKFKETSNSYHSTILKDASKFERVKVHGKLFKIEDRETRFYFIIGYYIHDESGSIVGEQKFKKDTGLDRFIAAKERFKVGDNISFKGKFSEYNDIKTLNIVGDIKAEKTDPIVLDEEENKRVELHIHTKMSAMDGVSTIDDYLQLAASYGHKALALTDHGVVQSFPSAQAVSSKLGIKMLYGSELYMVDEKMEAILNPVDEVLNSASYVIFDLETTGLSCRYDRIIEFGAVKISRGVVEEEINFFVNPGRPIPEKITKITHIDDSMVRNGKNIKAALDAIKELVKGSILVTHNANFDVGFINEALKNNGMPLLDNPVIDTLTLARYLFPTQRRHSLGACASAMEVVYDEDAAHRAIYDAQVLKDIFEGMLGIITANKRDMLHSELADLSSFEAMMNSWQSHVTVLAKNSKGLKDLFAMISVANTEYYASNPLVTKQLLELSRSDLLLGSSCQNGEVFQAALTRSKEVVKEKMKFYDYIEIQPPSCYQNLIYDGSISDEDSLEKILTDLVLDAKELGKMIVATSDAHYTRPDRKEFRDVYIFAKGLKGARHPLNPYRRDRGEPYPNPDQHFLTTKEMKEAFAFLKDPELIDEIVVKNTNAIADMIDSIKPIKDKLYTPTIKDCDKKLVNMVYQNAKAMYGDPLPDIIEERLKAELKGIEANNYYVIYYIASQLVTKTNEAGYIVGSRGSVGSSLIATMSNITEVNPLPPHYRCGKCKHLEWADVKTFSSGFDLPAKQCPICGEPLFKDGQNIPFATFLGFEAEKVPDIDLNFPSNFQAFAHEMTKDLLGAKNVFKAGTIETIADKTAIGYVKGYFEHFNIDPSQINEAELIRLADGCKDVKRTTGQHPGGIIVIPGDMSVYDFTPIQYPANSSDASWKTTHFDFHAIHDNVLKLDLLGHVDPYALKMMADLTGVDIYKIPFDDKEVLSLFSSTSSIHYKFPLPKGAEEYDPKVGTLGVPEFGTSFVRQMLIQTQPKSFSDLVIISGLSHGTDVYSGNAEELIKSKKSGLREVIGCRDDIMTGLHDKYGIDFSDSFQIMELVRKNNFTNPKLKAKREAYEALMREHNVPEYYIDSCCKIKYLFPKAHAVAYCMMGIRVGWFKIHRPLAYYATFFTVRCAQFDLKAMTKGLGAIVKALTDLDKGGRFKRNAKENELYLTLTIALEMTRRGYTMEKISISRSSATSFIVDERKQSLIPPFVLIPNLGAQVAESIVEAREKGSFTSELDVTSRTKLSESKINEIKETFADIFDLEDLPESDQMTLF